MPSGLRAGGARVAEQRRAGPGRAGGRSAAAMELSGLLQPGELAAAFASLPVFPLFDLGYFIVSVLYLKYEPGQSAPRGSCLCKAGAGPSEIALPPGTAPPRTGSGSGAEGEAGPSSPARGSCAAPRARGGGLAGPPVPRARSGAGGPETETLAARCAAALAGARARARARLLNATGAGAWCAARPPGWMPGVAVPGRGAAGSPAAQLVVLMRQNRSEAQGDTLPSRGLPLHVAAISLKAK